MFDHSTDVTRKVLYSLRPAWWQGYFGLSVKGLEHLPATGAFILCPNHTSHLDAPAVLAALPRDLALRTRTAAASDVWATKPWRLGAARIATHCVPIDRDGFTSGLRTLESVLKAGQPLILFPEGRRSPDGKLVDFKNGAAMLAMRTGVPIIPVHLSGLYESLPRKTHRLPKRTDVKVTFGQPISPAPYKFVVKAGWMDKHQAYDQMTMDVRAVIGNLRGARPAKRRHVQANA